MDNPCRRCSSEHRKLVREKANVNSCKTVCDLWAEHDKTYHEFYDKIKKRGIASNQPIIMCVMLYIETSAAENQEGMIHNDTL